MSSGATNPAERSGRDRANRDDQGDSWRPSALIEVLRRRATLLSAVREFFAQRQVTEVETPVLCESGAVEAHLDPVPVEVDLGRGCSDFYLVTSPELGMKRLLAAGSGPIYQITRAFRVGERGRLHNPEFSMLEWYRPGFNLNDLMNEVESLVREVFRTAGRDLGAAPFERLSYREAFERHLGIDPLVASVERFQSVAVERDLDVPTSLRGATNRDAWLNFLLAVAVEGKLGGERPTLLHHYPASQAALARVNSDDPRVAERFELYVDGVELSNGYHELADAEEQRRRFEESNEERVAQGRERLPLSERFFSALRSGLPDCAGVAVGLDRLFLVAIGGDSIDDVMTFPIERA